MYKKLNRDEEKLIREGTDNSAPPPKPGVILRNTLFFVLGFLLFVLIAWMVFSWGLAEF